MKAAGIGLAFCGSVLQSFGLILQKKAQNDGLKMDKSAPIESIWDDSKSEDTKGSDEEPDLPLPAVPDSTAYLKSNCWRFGFGIHTVGSILGFFSLSFVGPGLFIIISTFSLVVNLVMSPHILFETTYRSDWLAVFFIVSGISLCISAIETANSESLTVSLAASLISRPVAGIVWGSLVGLIVGLTYACRLKRGTVEPETSLQRGAFIVRASMSASLQVLLSTTASLLLLNPQGAPGFLWIVFSAMICNIVLDVHFQNRSLRFNDILTHGPISFVM